MKLVITSIKLKTPFHFFPRSYYAMNITFQLRNTKCIKYIKKGLGNTHYTMTRWNNEDELKQFTHSGAHKKAMKISSKIASRLVTLSMDTEALLPWDEAIERLNSHGKEISFGRN